MSKFSIRITCLAVLVGGLAATARADISMNFDAPVVTSATQAPGVWYTDRYAPAGFTSPVSFNGDNRLEQSIAGADHQTTAFYNTQGYKYDLQPNTTSMSIQLYVPLAWATGASGVTTRYAGFWGTGLDSSANVSAYPIIEFANVNGTGEFRLYNSNTGLWTDTALPSSGGYDQFYTLGVALQGSNIDYSINGSDVGSYVSNGTVALGNVILQGYNAGQDYSFYWDNFRASNTAVPEPASIISAVVGLAGVGLMGLRRNRKSAA